MKPSTTYSILIVLAIQLLPISSFTLSYKPRHLRIQTMNSVENSAFHDSYIDEQAALLSKAVARHIDLIPDNVKSILDDFYDKIMQIKLKVNELRYSYFIHARNQMDGLSDVLSAVQSHMISYSRAIAEGSDKAAVVKVADQIMQRIPQYFSNCYDSVLIKIVPQRSLHNIGAIETVINSLNIKDSVDSNRICSLEDTLPQVITELDSTSYEIDTTVEQSHLTTAVNECIIRNGKFARHELEVIRNRLRGDPSTNESNVLETPSLIKNIKETGYDDTINV